MRSKPSPLHHVCVHIRPLPCWVDLNRIFHNVSTPILHVYAVLLARGTENRIAPKEFPLRNKPGSRPPSRRRHLSQKGQSTIQHSSRDAKSCDNHTPRTVLREYPHYSPLGSTDHENFGRFANSSLHDLPGYGNTDCCSVDLQHCTSTLPLLARRDAG